jgi:hypothetical protein
MEQSNQAEVKDGEKMSDDEQQKSLEVKKKRAKKEKKAEAKITAISSEGTAAQETKRVHRLTKMKGVEQTNSSMNAYNMRLIMRTKKGCNIMDSLWSGLPPAKPMSIMTVSVRKGRVYAYIRHMRT